MNKNDNAFLLSRKQALKSVLTEQMKLRKENRDQRLIDQTKKSLDTIEGWLRPKKVESIVAFPPTPSPAIEKPVESLDVTKNETTEIKTAEEKLHDAIAAAAGKGAIMIVEDMEMLNRVWPVVKTSGTQISGPPHVIEAARKNILAETRNVFFRSDKAANVEFWGKYKSGEKFRNIVYCPHTRPSKIKNFIFQGLNVTMEYLVEFDFKSI